jgi:hypothetical protein
MVRSTRLSVTLSGALLGALAATAALAAPNGGGPASLDCYSAALLQYNIDFAQCSAIPVEARNPCLAQAAQSYAAAVVGCASKSTSQQITPPALKQNLDAAFTRRLR